MWPKTIFIKGVGIQAESWEEVDEIISRYGGDSSKAEADVAKGKIPKVAKSGATNLPHTDRVLLQQFVEREGWGLLNNDLSDALGVKGKSIGPALRNWSRRVGLTQDEGAEVFERFNRSEGRGYKLTPHFLKVAQSLLE